jgi:hypothetical protein
LMRNTVAGDREAFALFDPAHDGATVVAQFSLADLRGMKRSDAARHRPTMTFAKESGCGVLQ